MKLNIHPEIVKTDVLVIGGGIGGMQASIAAAEQGAKVPPLRLRRHRQ